MRCGRSGVGRADRQEPAAGRTRGFPTVRRVNVNNYACWRLCVAVASRCRKLSAAPLQMDDLIEWGDQYNNASAVFLRAVTRTQEHLFVQRWGRGRARRPASTCFRVSFLQRSPLCPHPLLPITLFPLPRSQLILLIRPALLVSSPFECFTVLPVTPYYTPIYHRPFCLSYSVLPA